MLHFTIYTSNVGADAPLAVFKVDGDLYIIDARIVGNSHGQAHRLCRGGNSVRETDSTQDGATLMFASIQPHIDARAVKMRKFQATMAEGALLIATSRRYWVEYIAIGYDDEGNQWTYSSDPHAPFQHDANFVISDDCRAVIFRSSRSRARYTRRVITYYDLTTGNRHDQWRWLLAGR
jgi:hypothetical protein